jgi:hypothetical protein
LLGAPPTIQVVHAPARAVVGRPVRVLFKVTHTRDGWAKVSTRSGVVFLRRYLIRDGTGVVEWTPTEAGKAVLLIRANGHQGQTASERLRIAVARAPEAATPPTVTILKVPDVATVGRAVEVAFRADGCHAAVARIEGPGDDVRSWRFPCPARMARFAWTPTSPGRHLLTILARGHQGQTGSASVRIDVAPRPKPGHPG